MRLSIALDVARVMEYLHYAVFSLLKYFLFTLLTHREQTTGLLLAFYFSQ